MAAVDGGSGALYVAEGGRFRPTALTEGPWDPDAQFGGAPASLLATVVDDTPSLVPMQVARLTVDLLRPVPRRPLEATRRIVREGKRIQVVEASLHCDGVEVSRCSALRLRVGDLGELGDHGEVALSGDDDAPDDDDGRTAGQVPLPAGPDPRFAGREPPGSHAAVEHRCPPSGRYIASPTWMRLRAAVIEGRPTAPVARLAYLADLASGLGNRRDLPIVGINADLSINVVRHPGDGWICLRGRGWTSRAGIGQVQATLSDGAGILAGVSVVRLVEREPATAGG